MAGETAFQVQVASIQDSSFLVFHNIIYYFTCFSDNYNTLI